MFLVKARDIVKDPTTLVANGNMLTILFAADGSLGADENGVAIQALGVTDAMLAGSISFNKLADANVIARLDQSETLTAVWNFGSYLPTLSTNPASPNQAVRKAYVDSAIEGLRINVSATVMSTENIQLTGFPELDGYQTVANDIVFCQNQTDATTNGNYQINSEGVWARPSNLDDGDTAAGVRVWVNEGTNGAGTCWICDSPVVQSTVGTHNLVFTQYPVLNQLINGVGLGKNGNELYVVVGHGVEISANAVKIKLDGTTLSVGVGGLKVNLINEDHISSTAFGNGLAGGSGDTIILSDLTADWDVGGNFTITNLPEPVDDSDVATKGYVDDQVSENSGVPVRIWRHTITAGEASAKTLTLPSVPSNTANIVLMRRSGPNAFAGTDFSVTTDQLTWDSLGLDGAMASGTEITVIYNE